MLKPPCRLCNGRARFLQMTTACESPSQTLTSSRRLNCSLVKDHARLGPTVSRVGRGEENNSDLLEQVKCHHLLWKTFSAAGSHPKPLHVAGGVPRGGHAAKTSTIVGRSGLSRGGRIFLQSLACPPAFRSPSYTQGKEPGSAYMKIFRIFSIRGVTDEIDVNYAENRHVSGRRRRRRSHEPVRPRPGSADGYMPGRSSRWFSHRR